MPLLDRVLVQRVKAETKTAGGIFLPESSVKELNEAKVLAVGPGGLDKDGKRITMSVAAGDKVLIPQVCDDATLVQRVANQNLVRWQPGQGGRRGVLAVQGS
jgi:co-chaperonin GroES (HSP10)